MPRFRAGPSSIGIGAALLVSSTLVGIGQSPGLADVSAVQGSAYGYQAADIVLFGGAQPDVAPAPAVALPSGGSPAPLTATAATGLVKHGPATILSSGPVTVSTQGTAGAGGSVTSSATMADAAVNSIGQDVFRAASLTSTCSASEAGATGTTTVTAGTLQTSQTAGPRRSPVVAAIPANPEPNTAVTGALETLGDTFRYVFNEQLRGPDGSITVNAVHLYLLGPTTTGDLIIGQSVCGVTSIARPAAPSPHDTTAPPPAAAPGPAPAPAPANVPTGVAVVGPRTAAASAPAAAAVPMQTADPTGSGAFGYVARVSLFQGPTNTRPCADPPANTADCRPRPAVTLPSGGSATPVTDSVPTADARFGPGIIFTSGPITVSTQGNAASTTSKVEIQNVNTSGQEVFTASGLSSTCTGSSGSTAVTGGTLRTSEGTNLDSDADDVNVQIPANPPPNTTHEGKIESVQDSYRAVFNEQIVKDGSITVNAFHMYLLGPTAVGELIVGQSRCGANAVSTPGSGTSGTPAAGTTAAGAAGTTSAAGGGATRTSPGMATTGFRGLRSLLLAMTLLALGTAASLGGSRLRRTNRRQHPPDAQT